MHLYFCKIALKVTKENLIKSWNAERGFEILNFSLKFVTWAVTHYHLFLIFLIKEKHDPNSFFKNTKIYENHSLLDKLEQGIKYKHGHTVQ